MDEQKKKQIEAELQRLISNNSQKLADKIAKPKSTANKVQVIRRRKGQKDKIISSYNDHG
jgi:hypothetical protein